MQGVIERDEQRKAAKLNRDTSDTRAEKTRVFFASLDDSAARLRAELLSFGTQNASASLEAKKSFFTGAIEEVRLLQAAVTRAAVFLAAYDVQKAQKSVAALEQTVRGFKARMLPRKPFTFERAREKQKIILAGNNAANAQEQRDEKTNVGDASNAAGVKMAASKENTSVVVGQRVVLQPTASNYLAVENYKDCIIIVESDALFSLKLANLVNCTLSCGPVRGSIFVHNCNGCKLSISGAQLRIHDCVDCQFHVRTRSDPIVEDCRELAFDGRYESDYKIPEEFKCPERVHNFNDFLEVIKINK